MTQYMGAQQNLLPFIILSRRIAGYLTTKNNRHADIAFICSAVGDNFNATLCSKFADSRDGLS